MQIILDGFQLNILLTLSRNSVLGFVYVVLCSETWKLNPFFFFPCRADDVRQPMSRIVPIPSSHLTPYRVVIILRLIILAFFLQYRITHPVKDAYPLWLTSVICEIWFAMSWILDQFPKWYPINRETYLDRLAFRLAFIAIILLYFVCVLV